MQACDVTFSKPCYNWLNKFEVYGMNQSEILLEDW